VVTAALPALRKSRRVVMTISSLAVFYWHGVRHHQTRLEG
jgi:hypothetical protein